MNNSLVPMVIKSNPTGERAMDIFSRLLEERIIDLSAGVDSNTSQVVRSCLLHLAHENDQEDINLYIDSPGGSVLSGMSIVDTMKLIKPKVNVFCVGMAASMGSVILCGATGTRYMLPHAQVMLHQVMSGSGPGTQVADIQIGTEHSNNINLNLKKFFLRSSKLTVDQVDYAFDRDTWFTAEEAIQYGLADEIVQTEHTYRRPDVDTSEFDSRYQRTRLEKFPTT